MRGKNKPSGVVLAAAAAALFTVAPVSSANSGEQVGKCFGINSCSGASDCATATSRCNGRNSCRGKGWLKTTKAQCDDKGGEFEA